MTQLCFAAAAVSYCFAGIRTQGAITNSSAASAAELSVAAMTPASLMLLLWLH
jgi:hypothetical protein